MSSTSFLAETRPYDRPVGTALLATYITLENVKEADPDIDERTFEAEVSRTFETFDYNKVLRSLKEYFSETGPVQDPKNDFLGALGFLHRNKSDNDFKTIITKWIIPEIRGLQAYAGRPRSESVPDRRDRSSPPPYSYARVQSETVESQQPAIEPQRLNSPNIEIWRYTSRLWEVAQLRNEPPPNVTDTQLRGFPARFQVIVEFGGVQAQGEASSKKQARHIASRDVLALQQPSEPEAADTLAAILSTNPAYKRLQLSLASELMDVYEDNLQCALDSASIAVNVFRLNGHDACKPSTFDEYVLRHVNMAKALEPMLLLEVDPQPTPAELACAESVLAPLRVAQTLALDYFSYLEVGDQNDTLAINCSSSTLSPSPSPSLSTKAVPLLMAEHGILEQDALAFLRQKIVAAEKDHTDKFKTFAGDKGW